MWDALHHEWHMRPAGVPAPEFAEPVVVGHQLARPEPTAESIFLIGLPLQTRTTSELAASLFMDIVPGVSAAAGRGVADLVLFGRFAERFPRVARIGWFSSTQHFHPPWSVKQPGRVSLRVDRAALAALVDRWWTRCCCALSIRDAFTAEIELGEPPPPWLGDDPPHLRRVAQWEAMSDAERQAAIDGHAAARAADTITLRSGRVISRG
ncbi:MAG: hypothetical protein AB7K09_13340 [Planctomycetota bacterium]